MVLRAEPGWGARVHRQQPTTVLLPFRDTERVVPYTEEGVYISAAPYCHYDPSVGSYTSFGQLLRHANAGELCQYNSGLNQLFRSDEVHGLQQVQADDEIHQVQGYEAGEDSAYESERG
ncbi:unnamed protein product [Miscanthus lutarioriparius]|uniref:Uncharacterized protein n=1 Tax=Miscanthus lutarioriparius TaxID=422564 RepID=A0A811RKT0_9POAL|nr:unnamed protein product [Miscanthus lutarioriparius]